MGEKSRASRAPRALLFLLATGLLLIPSMAAAAPLSGPSCTNVNAPAEGFGIPNFDTDGNLTGFDLVVTSALGGTGHGSTTIEKVTPGGTIHFSGTLHLADTEFGALTTTDNGIVTPTGRLNTKLIVIEGGSGFVTSNGVIDLETGVFQLHHRGRICA